VAEGDDFSDESLVGGEILWAEKFGADNEVISAAGVEARRGEEELEVAAIGKE